MSQSRNANGDEASTYDIAKQAVEGDQKSLEFLETKVWEGMEMDFSSENWIDVENFLGRAINAGKVELTRSLVIARALCPTPDLFDEDLLNRISVEILEALLEHPNFNVDAEDTNGSTMLHKAVSAKVEKLLGFF